MWNLVLCVCGIYIMSGFNVVNFKKKLGAPNCLSVYQRTLPTILTFETTDRFSQVMLIS